MNRRDFLRGTGAAIVPAALSVAISGTRWPVMADVFESALSPDVRPITAVVYDDRYTTCKIFAEALARQGAIQLPTSGDSASLWYGSLRAHLAQRDGRVAGFTTYSDFVVSRSCGRELSLRLLYEGAHDGRAPAGLVHQVRVSGDDREIAKALLRSHSAWPACLADALCRMPSPCSRRALASFGSESPSFFAAAAPRSAGHLGYLTPWLLALSAARESSAEVYLAGGLTSSLKYPGI